MIVFYAVLSPAGDILRTGHCNIEDVELQGELVWTFTTDPKIAGGTHRVDPSTGLITTLEGDHG